MKTASLQLENISKEFGEGHTKITALKKTNFAIFPGEFVAIVGPSGSGKSTFLTLAGVLQQPTEGKIFIQGEDVSTLSKKESTALRLKEVGFILQSTNLIPFLSVKDQFIFLDKIQKRPFQEELFENLMTSLDTKDLANKMPRELSGGEKQRIAIGKALYNNPALILADEPTAALDTNRAFEVVKLLQKEAHDKNKATIMVTHDQRMTAFCDKVYTMEDGYLTQSKN